MDEDDEDLPAQGPARAAIPPELVRLYRTQELPPISGEARVEPEDFLVEEVPAYEACGEGEHLYVTIEKRGLATPDAVARIARAVGVRSSDVGYAGLKDARAVTRQTLSLPRVDEKRLVGWKDPQVQVLAAKRHKNKLKIGHLKGNKFTIRLRGAAPGDEERARAILEKLAASGAPNYFGLQRFGSRRNNHELGLALVREDSKKFVELLLGAAISGESPRVQEARGAWARGDARAALAAFPSSFQSERAVLSVLERTPGEHERAVRSVPLKWRRFFASALQSFLFNRYLSRRLGRMDQLEEGEIAFLHRNGAAFLVEDAAKEQPRAASQEISPSGPLFGSKLLRPREGSSPRADEDAVLAEGAPGLTAELSAALGASPRGERRALRVVVADASVSSAEGDLLLKFFLTRGSYATSVLEELLRRPVD